jgi:nucleotide-binding universal stress UspA family protein
MSHFQNILVPVDGSPSSIAALEQALALADEATARIHVLHVNTPEATREMEDAMAEAERRLGGRLVRRTEAGEPVRKILETAAAEDADLIVMGTHGRVGRLHALVGSVAEGVLRSAPCPVLTVRRKTGEEESFAERIHGRKSIAEQTRSPRR